MCEYAYVADEVGTYLRKEYGHITVTERNRIAQLVKEIPGIIYDQAGLRVFQFPPVITKSVPFIAAPVYNGIRCNECGFIIRITRGIQEHCRKEHGWEND
ncbi:hypothetical protein QBC43DRAFT_223885 [Cladorrhinum sp. PSN259]|nr:hypothetical protein QBC43DRAFT_223885 [Cladorrhinum sp. PSN259]